MSGGKSTGVDGVLFIAFSVLVGLVVHVIWSDSKFLKKYFPLPYTVVIFVIGLAWGYCTPKYKDGYSLDTALYDLVGIDPHLFLQLFIPPLLFESGWAMNIHMFKKVSFSCIWLAGLGVVGAMLLTAMLCYYVYPDSWSWNTCLVFGAMAAATDPVAVAAVLKELGAPETLATVIEGERSQDSCIHTAPDSLKSCVLCSLLNDGSSFVFFSLFLKSAGSTQDAGDITKTLFQMYRIYLYIFQTYLQLPEPAGCAHLCCDRAIGGAAFGAVMGVASALCLKLNYHRNNHFFVVIFTLVMPYITFWVAENPLGLSGVLAVVIMALVTNRQGKIYVRRKHELHEFWENIAFVCNTIVTQP